jgi:adenine-specific DNA-methyltransferase
MANEKTEIEKLDLKSMNIAEEKQNELLRLFPEIRTEGGKIDFDKLKLTLGELVDTGKVRFGLNWPGKAECFTTIQTPSTGSLLPNRDDSINFDSSENLFIEGDNLEVLKLLQKSYLNKIRIVYIDPPYNTGNDFIYPDNYTENLQTYLEYTGQIDSTGKKFSTNTDSSGRFHTKWLNMIFPRLYLARNLLSDDGIIFISIDEAEVANLRLLCNDIFGEENFLAILSRRTKSGGGSAAHHFAIDNDFVLAFAKNKEFLPQMYVPYEEEYLKRYSEEDKIGKYFWDTFERSYTATRPYKIKAPDGTMLSGKWFRSEERFLEDLKNGEMRFIKKDNGKWSVQFKQRISGGRKIRSLLFEKEFRSSQEDLISLDMEDIFDFPKPVHLLKHLIRGGNNDDIVLDFFAGSATVAQAVLELNLEDGGKRKFIAIQLPEPISPESEAGKIGLKTIADIGKLRIKKFLEKNGAINKFGFRSFKLSESNFKTWSQDTSKENLANQLELHVDHVKHDRSADDIFYEILLKSGFPLTTKVETQKLGKQTVYSIAGGMLLVCLEDNLTLDLIKHIAEQKPERVVCLDQGFANNDQLKANAVQIFRTKGIASFKTV